MAAPTCVLTVTKRFTYRGDANEEFSNTYAFTGTTPTDTSAWRALFDALVLQEKTLFPTNVFIIKGYGYNKIPVKGDHAIYSVDLRVSPNTPVAGTIAIGSNVFAPGDGAFWIRWGLDRFSSKGKRLYLRKYYHPAIIGASGGDSLSSAQVTPANAFGTKLRDGSFIDGRVLTDRLGTALIGSGTSVYATTRTLKRRGKRPPT